MILIHRVKEPIEVGQVPEPESCRIECGHPCEARLLEMRCRAEAIVLRLIEESLHDLRIVGAHLHPLDPILGGPTDPLPCLLGAIEWSLVPCSSRPLIIYDPRRNDLIPITPRLLLEYPLMTTEEHTSELQSRGHLVCRLLLEKKKYTPNHGGAVEQHSC